MEDDLKIFKLEYLRTHWSDFSQNINLSSGDQTKIANAWKEENLKILKVEYLSNHWSDFPQILNLSLGDQTKIKYA